MSNIVTIHHFVQMVSQHHQIHTENSVLSPFVSENSVHSPFLHTSGFSAPSFIVQEWWSFTIPCKWCLSTILHCVRMVIIHHCI
jgi:hypothetical protein